MAKKQTMKELYAKTACDAHNGYHNGGATRDDTLELFMLGKIESGRATHEEKMLSYELDKAFARSASFEENCERAYRQMNAVIRRLRRVRDAYGRVIGKCR